MTPPSDTLNGHPPVRDYFRRLLRPLWLRPERALWDAHELFAVRDLLGDHIERPSLEFGCTDGVNTFVLMGGEFGMRFDDYRQVSWSLDSHTRSTGGDDYFDSFSGGEDAPVDIVTRPEEGFDVGLSWKETHVRKADRLDVYERTVRLDLDEPLLPFESGSFATIWAPNLFWVAQDRLPGALEELRRILDRGGRIVTIFPDAIQGEHMLYRFAGRADAQWMADLDRGTHDNFVRHARSLEAWTAYLEGVGLTIGRRRAFLPSIVGQVYDIGLRPMFPVFMNIYETLLGYSEDDLLEVKEHWIETAYDFLAPLCDAEWMSALNTEMLWHALELHVA